ncbi:hypothetical protein QQZ08_000061 [Neonectria magnoliae]|uniref:Uncharacterized protein n=1 Tax=Neonectria magnoliae TaxID=2732573 RepID=A0ABR1IJN0_9HYPO
MDNSVSKISIRLHDLLKNSLGSADIISVEKQRNELCIKIPGQGRAIIAQFEEKRDFSVAVYMLEKTHIRINNSITSDLLTPYNMFLGRSNSQVHTPRVSSPLRQSLNPEEDTGRSPGPPFGYSPYVDGSQASLDLPTIPPDAPRTTSVNDGSPYTDLSKTTGRVPLSPNAHASPEPSSQGSDQSFRDLMPRPRELPFSSRPKMLEPKKVTSLPQNSPTKKQSLPRHKSDIKELEVHSEAVGADSPRRTTFQATNETPTPKEARPQTIAEAEEHTGSTIEVTRSSSPLESLWSPIRTPPNPELTILVTELETLKQLNQMTAKLFEQYEADIASGMDEEASAKFYMDRIMDTRRDFWSTKLGHMFANQWPMPC